MKDYKVKTSHGRLYKIFYIILIFVLKTVFKLLYRVKKYNFEKIPSKGKLIICSNHISFIDPVIIGANIPRYIYFMAKRELFKNRLLGSFIAFLNSFPVNRTATDRSSIRTALNVLKDGQMLALFPEGTRSVEGKIMEGKKGVGLLAVLSEAPIVPMAITGANKIVQKPHKRLFFPQIRMIAGDMIDVRKILAEYGRKEAVQVIVDRVMCSIKKLYDQIN